MLSLQREVMLSEKTCLCRKRMRMNEKKAGELRGPIAF